MVFTVGSRIFSKRQGEEGWSQRQSNLIRMPQL